MVKTSKKTIKKSFFEISAPFTSSKISLYGESPESLAEKTVKLDLTKDLKGKSLELKLRIKNNNGELRAEPEMIELVGSYIRRVMRKGVDYVEDSFITETREGLAQVKPFLLTRKRVSKAIQRALRNETKKFIEVYLKTRTYQEIFSDIITNKLQKNLSSKLKKIYPLALCEIRIFSIIKKK
ncbi:MAG: hypothetical protein AABY05_01815 [Nanoarchaeota archaeon]